MTSAYTYIVDSYLRLVPSSKLKLVLLWSDYQKMDVTRSVLVKWHGLKQDVVSSTNLLNFLGQINNLENSLFDFEGVGIHVLADLTFESLPVERSDVLGGLIDRLLLLLGENPTLETLEMNESNRTFAFAC